jgi:hypothetical protein
LKRIDRKRVAYIRAILRRGPTEAGYAFFRALRRRRNVADDEPHLLPSDRLVLSDGFEVSAEDIEANARLVRAQIEAGPLQIRTLGWFVPGFHLVWGGGVHTLLRFADHLARAHGVKSSFCVFDSDDPAVVERVRRAIAEAFPALEGVPVTARGVGLPACDAAIATAWESAWRLVRFRAARAKFMFVQDWEPDFYPAGSASAMLTQAARLGIPGIVNTAALADSYRAHGSPAVSFVPAVDTRRFHPAKTAASGPVRIFFYGRPSTARNAFGLGLGALRLVKERHGDAVQIVCAGEDFSPGQFGVADVLDNLGQLDSLDRVAELYRSCQVGLVFMLTRHPSYQPLEFMASGVATVTNENPHTNWLLRHEGNALLAPPVPALVADQITRLVEDPALRERLVAAGQITVESVRWEEQFERVWRTATGHRSYEDGTGGSAAETVI